MPGPISRTARRAALLTIVVAFSAAAVRVAARPHPPAPSRTTCDSLIPLSVDLVPLTDPKPGGVLQLQVEVQSGLDPDEVRSTRIEYQVPQPLRRSLAAAQDRDIPLRQGRGRTRLSVTIPDREAYEIRARVVVELRNGRTVAQTAVRWVNAGPDYRPQGMIGRVVLPDGAGIRVYQGVTAR